jgi:lysozyme
MSQHHHTRHPDWSLLWVAKFTAKWEGFIDHAYLDTIASPPVWTGAFGHTHGVRPGQIFTEAEGRKLLAADLRDAARAVAAEIHVPLTVRQRMAVIDAVFNIGPGLLEGTHFANALNAKRYTEAANRLLEWDHAGGVVVEGLRNRREAERWLFLHDGRKSRQVPVHPHHSLHTSLKP